MIPIRPVVARAATALLVGLALAGSAEADEFETQAGSAFAPVVKEFDIPGLVVGVTREGVHRFYATGVASRAGGSPVTPDTLFELGSISKIFTATLAALAETRGTLRLDDPVARHVCAGACRIGNDPTLMDLATHHTGGLPLQVPDAVADVPSLVEWLKRWKPVQPGARSYSNIGIGLLGDVSAKALGMSYREAAETVLFPAFGLRNTFIDVPMAAMRDYAWGHERKTGRSIRVTPGVLDAEAYGVKSTARDMLRMLDAELGLARVPDDLRAAIARTQEGQFRTVRFTQDMVWEQYPWPAGLDAMVSGNSPDFILKPQPMEPISPPLPPQKDVILNKTGSTNGFGGYVAMIPSEGLGVVVLANRNYPNEARVKATYRLIEALLAR